MTFYKRANNPPIPEWNNLSDEERGLIVEEWEQSSCSHACGGSPIGLFVSAPSATDLAIRVACYRRRETCHPPSRESLS